MPNIKSVKKDVLRSRAANEKNKQEKSALKTTLKKFEVAVAEGNKAGAQELLNVCVKKLDQAAAKGVYHKNTVSRKKSQLAKAIAALA